MTMTGILVNGHPWSTKSARDMDGLVRAAQSAADLEAWDAVMESFTDACEQGHLTGVETEVVSRSLGRALTRLEGAGGSGGGRGETKAGPGGLEYGAPVQGIRVG